MPSMRKIRRMPVEPTGTVFEARIALIGIRSTTVKLQRARFRSSRTVLVRLPCARYCVRCVQRHRGIDECLALQLSTHVSTRSAASFWQFATCIEWFPTKNVRLFGRHESATDAFWRAFRSPRTHVFGCVSPSFPSSSSNGRFPVARSNVRLRLLHLRGDECSCRRGFEFQTFEGFGRVHATGLSAPGRKDVPYTTVAEAGVAEDTRKAWKADGEEAGDAQSHQLEHGGPWNARVVVGVASVPMQGKRKTLQRWNVRRAKRGPLRVPMDVFRPVKQEPRFKLEKDVRLPRVRVWRRFVRVRCFFPSVQ